MLTGRVAIPPRLVPQTRLDNPAGPGCSLLELGPSCCLLPANRPLALIGGLLVQTLAPAAQGSGIPGDPVPAPAADSDGAAGGRGSSDRRIVRFGSASPWPFRPLDSDGQLDGPGRWPRWIKAPVPFLRMIVAAVARRQLRCLNAPIAGFFLHIEELLKEPARLVMLAVLVHHLRATLGRPAGLAGLGSATASAGSRGTGAGAPGVAVHQVLPIDLVVLFRLRRPGGLRRRGYCRFVVVACNGKRRQWQVPLARAWPCTAC